ncbi:MAG: L-threonylcarbamoyladenylate synthase [Pseudomonadota bacterium]|jgi:L-threonylcarbamoyladenylate synthase
MLTFDESQFHQAVSILRDGGLIIAPTETFYGIIADAYSQKAIDRVVTLKEREFGNPIPLIAGDTITVSKSAAYIPPVFKPLADKFWPGPLTLVLKAAEGFPDGVTAGTGSIGIRIPAQSPALDLAKFIRGPLTATSANFSGRPPARNIRDLDEELVKAVDLVIDGGWTPGVKPSTVLNLTTSPPELIRSGILGKEVIDFLAKTREKR